MIRLKPRNVSALHWTTTVIVELSSSRHCAAPLSSHWDSNSNDTVNPENPYFFSCPLKGSPGMISVVL